MTQYDNTNSGALFKNDRKESEKHPDYTGQINVGGVDFWLSAWIKKSKAGKPFMSLSVKLKEPAAVRLSETKVVAPDIEFNDDIPF